MDPEIAHPDKSCLRIEITSRSEHEVTQKLFLPHKPFFRCLGTRVCRLWSMAQILIFFFLCLTVLFDAAASVRLHTTYSCFAWASLVAQLVKNPPAMQET